jgi:hypothetical protein
MKPKYVVYEDENGFEYRKDFNEAVKEAENAVRFTEIFSEMANSTHPEGREGYALKSLSDMNRNDSAGYPQLEELTGVTEIHRQIIRDLLAMIDTPIKRPDLLSRARAAISID